MPLYVQDCEDCKKMYEVLVPLSRSEEEIKCPHCGRVTTRIIMPVYFKVR